MPTTHPLIEQAKSTVQSWESDEPRDLTVAAASLCRLILDSNGLADALHDLRQGFNIESGQSISETICLWDDNCNQAEWPLDDEEGYVKVGVVTWVTKFVLKKFNMLSGAEPIACFDEWKQSLCDCFDKYILISS